MRDVQKLRDLLERVEKAAGPDSVLDMEIGEALNAAREDFIWTMQGRESVFSYERVTTSLDASIALVDRMLPGWGVGFDKRAEFSPIAWVRPNDQRSDADRLRPAATAPLAILSALLCALISQAEGEGA